MPSITDLLEVTPVRGSHFSGPLVSGAPEDGPAGLALLAKRFTVKASQGVFSIPVVMPPGAILLQLVAAVTTLFDGTTPAINIGTTANGAELGTAALTAAAKVFQNITVNLPTNNTFYVSKAGAGSTVGAATVMIIYSLPAQVVQS